jgi:hypothetical protein
MQVCMRSSAPAWSPQLRVLHAGPLDWLCSLVGGFLYAIDCPGAVEVFLKRNIPLSERHQSHELTVVLQPKLNTPVKTWRLETTQAQLALHVGFAAGSAIQRCRRWPEVEIRSSSETRGGVR